MTEGAQRGIGEAAREMMQSAAELGVSRPWLLLACTPRELQLELRARMARRQAELERLDLAGWLAGRYAMIGLHAPRRYPKKPCCVRRQAAPMTDEQMKRAFAAMAEERT